MLPDPPAPQVDQQQLQSNTEFTVGGNSVVAQTFTPGITGAITQVDIVVSVETAVAGDVMMEIRTLNDPGNPTSGAILGSVTVPGAGVPVGAIQTLSFDFSLLPPMLVNGLTYAMVLRSPTNVVNNIVWRSQVQSDPYAGGAGFASNDDVAVWNPVNGDQVFTTTMQPQGDPRIEVVPSTPELLFGNTISSSIHGFKFEDLDADGIYEPLDGDLPQANVPFQLTGINSRGQFVNLITNTDASGQFWFEDLLPSVFDQGQQSGYTVTEIAPFGFYPTTDIPQRNFDLSSGIELAWQPGAAMLGPNDPQQEVVVGQELIFGNTASVSIHGFKFEDIDGDGQYDPNEDELPLAGVTFTLTGTDGQGNVVNQTVLTDDNGEFWFTGREVPEDDEGPEDDFLVLAPLLPSVAGQGEGTGYTVTETVPTGFVSTTLPIARTFDLASRQELVWRDGAAMLPPTPVPQVDQTQQDNDVPDPLGETVFRAQSFVPGLTGGLTQVELSIEGVAGVGDVVLEIQTLNAAGNPSGSVLASATVPSANVPVGSNQTISFDFSVAPPTLLAGASYAMVLSSPNSNSQIALGWDSSGNNDPYASGVSFRSGDSGANWIPFADFDHVFTTFMLPQADPRVEVLATANGGFIGDQLMFGNTVPGSFHGFKFIDYNRNGVYDPNSGERPQAGVEFQLTGRDGLGDRVDFTVTTDDNGEFWFVGLPPSVAGEGQGTGYTITEIVPAGFVATTPTVRTFDLRSRQEFVWQQGAAMLDSELPQFEVLVGRELMFGNISTGSFHGFKFEDVDGDGVFDPDELPLPGIAFQLTGTDNNGTWVNRTEFTDQTGQFWFEDLIPSIAGQGQGTGYTISEKLSPGFIPTTPTSRFFNLPGGIEYVWQSGAAMLDPNDPNTEEVVGEQLIFGNTVPGSIHGFKFFDRDGDGVYDPNFGESPQPGVEFQLSGIDGLGNAINRTAFTNGIGEFWLVGLPPSVAGQGQGTGYTLTEIVPPGFFATTAVERTFNLNSRQELVWQTGAAMLNPQFDPQIEVLVGRELIFGNTIPGSFHGFKFLDRDGDGVYEPNGGDLPQPGVDFQLTGTDAFGNAIDLTETTNDNGEFWFEELFPSVDGQGQGTGYTITEIVPQGFVATTPIVRTFNLLGGQELAWRDGAAMLDPRVDLQQEVVVGRELIFGNTIPGSFHGFKFADIDANGQYDPLVGDTPQPNVQLPADRHGNRRQPGRYHDHDRCERTILVRRPATKRRRTRVRDGLHNHRDHTCRASADHRPDRTNIRSVQRSRTGLASRAPRC